MIRKIMAFFGYIKVPQAAIELSKNLDKFVNDVCDTLAINKNVKKDTFEIFRVMSKTIVDFLKSGNL